jgi:hypothetical protein
MNPRYLIPLIFAVIFNVLPIALFAGPPYLTDDPEPLGKRHVEFIIAPQILNEVDRISAVLPGVELNYGLTGNLMAHVIVPLILTKPDGAKGTFSLGDVELGLKYRFIKESDRFPQIGTFPHVNIPPGDSSKGVGSGSLEAFIPIWIQKALGPWTTYGGGGLWVRFSSGSNRFWFFGWELQRKISDNLTLGAELFATTGSFESKSSETGFNVGGSYDFSENHHVLFSAGRDFLGPNTFLLYLAYQLTFRL